MIPHFVPALTFGLAEQRSAFEEYGSNCGPGAIAGTCGLSPREVLGVMPPFQTFGHTREWMLEGALDALGVAWEHEEPDVMRYGIARVFWGGPWSLSSNRFEALAHSHWIGIARSDQDDVWVFDINAISKNGWIPMKEWEDSLVPCLMEQEEPEWDGLWCFGEGYAFAPSRYKDEGYLRDGRSERMRSLGISGEEHPYLHSNPMICGGRVVIRHSRITTTSVAGRIDGGETVNDLLEDHPDLTVEMVEAALGHGRRLLASMPR